MPRPKSKKNQYWGDEQEKAVCEYIELEHILFKLNDIVDRFDVLEEKGYDDLTFEEQSEYQELLDNLPETNKEIVSINFKKNKIYNSHLNVPLNTMVDCIIRRYNLYSTQLEYGDLHTDTLSYLMTKMHKYSPNRVSKKTGLVTKSYSYYQTIIKHKLLANRYDKQKDIDRYTYYDDAYKTFGDDEKVSYTIDHQFDDSKERLVNRLLEYVQYVLDVSGSSITPLEEKLGKAIIEILDNWQNIFEPSSNNKLNKNSILFSLREITKIGSTKDIRTGIKPYKAIYYMLKEDMIDRDEL